MTTLTQQERDGIAHANNAIERIVWPRNAAPMRRAKGRSSHDNA